MFPARKKRDPSMDQATTAYVLDARVRFLRGEPTISMDELDRQIAESEPMKGAKVRSEVHREMAG